MCECLTMRFEADRDGQLPNRFAQPGPRHLDLHCLQNPGSSLERKSKACHHCARRCPESFGFEWKQALRGKTEWEGGGVQMESKVSQKIIWQWYASIRYQDTTCPSKTTATNSRSENPWHCQLNLYNLYNIIMRSEMYHLTIWNHIALFGSLAHSPWS